MDGLSIAASIEGLVTIADSVVRQGYKYVRDVKDAENSVAVLVEDVNKLTGIIHSLGNVARRCEDEKYDIEPTTQLHEIEACLKTLQSIQTHFEESDPAAAADSSEKIKRKLKWTLNKSKVRQLMLQIDKHQTIMSLAMKATGMSSFLKLLAGQSQVHEVLLQVRRDFEEDRNQRAEVAMTEQRRKYFQVLGSVEAQKLQDSNNRLRQPGTGI